MPLYWLLRVMKDFNYEGYALVISLFIIKVIESISQRQWYFRSRLFGWKLGQCFLQPFIKNCWGCPMLLDWHTQVVREWIMLLWILRYLQNWRISILFSPKMEYKCPTMHCISNTFSCHWDGNYRLIGGDSSHCCAILQ